MHVLNVRASKASISAMLHGNDAKMKSQGYTLVDHGVEFTTILTMLNLILQKIYRGWLYTLPSNNLSMYQGSYVLDVCHIICRS